MTVETTAVVKAVNFDGYRIEFTEDRQSRPVGKLFKVLTVGKNKGRNKQLQGYYFNTLERREQWAKEQIESIKGRIKDEQQRKERNKQAKESHNFKLGDILYQSWGYDQTNIDFFQVVDILPKSVKIRGIGQIIVPGSDGFMSEYVKPDINNFTSEATTRPIKAYTREGQPPIFAVSNGRHSLSLYNGGESGIYQSHYA